MKTTKRLMYALACLLAASSGNASADPWSLGGRTFLGGLDAGPTDGDAVSFQREASKRPLSEVMNQVSSPDERAFLNVWENWLQWVSQSESQSELSEPIPAPSATGTIEVDSPIEIDESVSKQDEINSPKYRKMNSISLDMTAPSGSMPSNPAALRYDSDQIVASFDPRPWQEDVYLLTSPVFYHRPLYFEEPDLERHGRAHFPVLRPVISGAHFAVNGLTLPYQLIVHPPYQHVLSSRPSSLRIHQSGKSTLPNRKPLVLQTTTVADFHLLE